MNKFIGIGRLTADPQIKDVGGKQLANFSIAINRSFNKEQTDFISCVVWGKTAEYIGKYGKKGQLVSVDGELNINKSGDKYYTQINTAQVSILSSKNDGETSSSQPSSQPSKPQTTGFGGTSSANFGTIDEDLEVSTKSMFDTNDDMPF